jgi:hypothetical protein
MITITFLLNALCQGGMSIISWIIVFIPFIFMTVIVTILLYVFGLDAATGTLKFKCTNPTTTSNSNSNSNLIYSSTTDTDITTTNTSNKTASPYVSSIGVSVSSDPQYQ